MDDWTVRMETYEAKRAKTKSKKALNQLVEPTRPKQPLSAADLKEAEEDLAAAQCALLSDKADKSAADKAIKALQKQVASVGKLQKQVAAEQVQGILDQGYAALYGTQAEIRPLRIDYLYRVQILRPLPFNPYLLNIEPLPHPYVTHPLS